VGARRHGHVPASSLRGGVTSSNCARRISTTTLEFAPRGSWYHLSRLRVPFVMNDSPELAQLVGADGVHVGQDDVSVARCRELLGDEAIVDSRPTQHTSSTRHSPKALRTSAPAHRGDADQTRTRRHWRRLRTCCERRSDRPVFVTGGSAVRTSPNSSTSGFAVSSWSLPHRRSRAERAARELREALDFALSTVTVEPT